jgi:hypothetical protein
MARAGVGAWTRRQERPCRAVELPVLVVERALVEAARQDHPRARGVVGHRGAEPLGRAHADRRRAVGPGVAGELPVLVVRHPAPTPDQDHPIADRVVGHRGVVARARRRDHGLLRPGHAVPGPGVGEVAGAVEATEQHHPAARAVIDHAVAAARRRAGCRREPLPDRAVPGPGVVEAAAAAVATEQHDPPGGAVERHRVIGARARRGQHGTLDPDAVPLPGVGDRGAHAVGDRRGPAAEHHGHAPGRVIGEAHVGTQLRGAGQGLPQHRLDLAARGAPVAFAAVAVVAPFADGVVDRAVAAALVRAAVERAPVGADGVAVVAGLAQAAVDDPVAAARDLAGGPAPGVGHVGVGVAVVARLAAVGVDDLVAAGRDLAGGPARRVRRVGVVGAEVALLAHVADAVAAHLGGVTVARTAVAVEVVAVVARLVGIGDAVAAARDHADLIATPPLAAGELAHRPGVEALARGDRRAGRAPAGDTDRGRRADRAVRAGLDRRLEARRGQQPDRAEQRRPHHCHQHTPGPAPRARAARGRGRARASAPAPTRRSARSPPLSPRRPPG